MFKKFLSLFLVVLTCLSLFACAKAEGNDPQDSTTALDDVTGPASEVTTEAPASDIEIASKGNAEYKVIRPEKANEIIVKSAINVRNAVADVTGNGSNVKLSTDWHKKDEAVPAKAKEIVVGVCDRPETEAILGKLREKDFAVIYTNERIYILGGCDSATAEGTEYFIETYVKNAQNGRITVKSDLDYLNAYNYYLGNVKINGVDIDEYNIVIPENCDLFTLYAAQNLSDYLKYNGGIDMTTMTDSETTSEYEFLVGNTNRPESAKAKSVTLGENQYVLAETGSKIVMYGNSYMVGGAVSDFINNYAKPAKRNNPIDISDIPTFYAASTFKFEAPRSALLMIGDGMGFNHVSATVESGKIDAFVGDLMPNKGESKSASYSVQMGQAEYTDSAAAGTALATGCKTYNRRLGLNYKGNVIPNVREVAHDSGARTAILTTDNITGATPAAFLVHVKDRDMTADIKKEIDRLLDEHLVEYAVSKKDSDDIFDEIPAALWGISEGGSNYFSMIEAAYIDKQSHKNRLDDVTDRVVRYNYMLAYTIEFTICHPDSVMIVTADHECGGLIRKGDSFVFTSSHHTNENIPVYAIGKGTEIFNKTTTENTDIAKFIAKIFGNYSFGG